MGLVTLPHSGLQVPTARVRITRIDEVDIGTGIAWSGTVREGRKELGAFTNDGRGGATLFRAAGADGMRRMREFIAACRTADGRSVDEEAVGDALAEEHEAARMIAAAKRRGQSAMRAYDRIGTPAYLHIPVSPGPESVRELADEIAQEAPSVMRAELWDDARHTWVEIYRAD